MATISHEPLKAAPEKRRWTDVLVREAWVSLAIAMIWLSVVFEAIYGPNIETSSAGGTDTAVIPSAVIVSVFAFLATWVVAKYGFRERRD
jgi:hypothetical protein